LTTAVESLQNIAKWELGNSLYACEKVKMRKIK
jgi:hypothetical protein